MEPKQQKRRHLANIITLTRIFGVVFIFWITPFKTNFWQLSAIYIYILICTTDYLDGWVARKLKIESDLGKVLDPLADKILVLVFLPLLEMQAISSFPVFIILAREFAIMALRIVSAKDGVIIAAKFSGKLKTALTFPLCGILLGRIPVIEVALPKAFFPLEMTRLWVITWPNWVFNTLIWTVVVVTIWSFFDYFNSFLWQQYVKKMNGDEKLAKKRLLSMLPNSFTVLNLIFGTVAAGMAWFGYFHTAVLLVILGIVLDAVDGSLARRLDAISEFGQKLDSKADFMSFGVAPAVVIFRIISQPGGAAPYLGAVLGLGYYLSVHYRLRRFDESGHTPYFDGLPSPAGAAVIVIAAISQYLSQT